MLTGNNEVSKIGNSSIITEGVAGGVGGVGGVGGGALTFPYVFLVWSNGSLFIWFCALITFQW